MVSEIIPNFWNTTAGTKHEPVLNRLGHRVVLADDPTEYLEPAFGANNYRPHPLGEAFGKGGVELFFLGAKGNG